MVCISGIPVRERLRQEVHHKAKASLSYTARPRLKRKQTWKEASLLLWVPCCEEQTLALGETFSLHRVVDGMAVGEILALLLMLP